MVGDGEGRSTAGGEVGDAHQGAVPVQGEGPGEDEEHEEASERRPLPTPVLPSASEVAHHKTTHCPYRSWCDKCVEAFGREWPHHQHGSGPGRSVPIIHMDYAFLTDRGLFKRDELNEEDMRGALTVLVVYDSSSKGPFCHAVLAKGAGTDGYAGARVAEDIAFAGHTRVILRSDNEPALLQVVADALKNLRVQQLDAASSEGSVPYDPQTAGAAEVTVRNLKGQVRAMQLTLDRCLGMHVPPRHPLMAWLVEHAAFVRFTGIVGADGKTAYSRVRGVEHSLRFPFFGECVRFKSRAQEKGGVAGEGMTWSSGVWLGVHRRTNQYVLYDDEHGIRHARTIMRYPDAQKFSAEAAQKVSVGPQQIHVPEQRDAIFKEPADRPLQEGEVKERQARRFYVRQKDLDAYGYSDRCPRCEHALKYGNGRCNLPHSDACRQRIIEKLRETPDGRRRIAEFETKTDRYVAEQVEKNNEPNIERDAAAQGGIGEDGRQQDVQDGDVATRGRPPAFLPLPEAAARNSASDPVNDPNIPYSAAGPGQAPVRGPLPQAAAPGEIFEPDDRVPQTPTDRDDRIPQTPLSPSPADAAANEFNGPGMDVDLVNLAESDAEDEQDLRDIVRLYEVQDREAGRQRQAEILSVIESLGGDRRAYRRERAKAARAIVAEFYSPPRVGALARELPGYGVAPGLALDLTTYDSQGRPWDFSKPEMRREAERLFDEQCPTLLVGTPMCTAFSSWQHINAARRDPGVVAKEKAAGRMHLSWMCKMYARQIDAGRLILHEHPAHATSWSEDCVRGIMRKDGVSRITADQCQLGQQDEDGNPVKKPTWFMSNSPDILDALNRRCVGRGGVCSRAQGGRHQVCAGRTARRAAIFQRELCEAILIGLRNHLRRTGRMHRNEHLYSVDCCGVMIDGDDDVREYVEFSTRGEQGMASSNIIDNGNVTAFQCDGSRSGWAPLADEDKPAGGEFQDAMGHTALSKSGRITATEMLSGAFGISRHERYIDDLTGQQLPEKLCREARAVELDYFREKEVWAVRKVGEALKRTGRPPITVRCVEVNEGDDLHPRIRSRLVAREIRMHGQDTIFAPTPPLESLRMVLSHAATRLPGEKTKIWEPEHEDRQMIYLMDISRAYFNAKVPQDEPVYVELPPEMHPEPGTCALLKRHMYGTRRAADGWQSEYSGSLRELGFTQGTSSACVFRHADRAIAVSVHGDDFACSGPRTQLQWLEAALKERYELTVGGRLGPGESDDHEGLVLNRVIRWTHRGLEYEADPRQGERLVEDLGLEGADSSRLVTTPGVKALAPQIESETPLPSAGVTPFRRRAARANYLGPDRPDLVFTAKEACRGMSAPTDLHQAALKRMGRYLRARPRLVFRFDYQEATHVEAYADTDWAGCARSRRSTSGGCLRIGTHLLKCWSSTQAGVAMSSGEAEFYGAVRGASAGLGMRALYSDIGYKLPLRLWTDSSAAVGIAGRQGLGKLRHVECTSLWLQQRLRQRDLEIRKIAGDANPADLYTKYIESRVKIEQLLGLFGAEFRDGRPEAAPKLRRGALAAGVCDHEVFDVCEEREAVLHDTSVLPHLMTPEDIEDHFPRAQVLPLPAGEADARPSDELGDPGPRGHLELAPAFFDPDSESYAPGKAFLCTEHPRARAVGRGMRERVRHGLRREARGRPRGARGHPRVARPATRGRPPRLAAMRVRRPHARGSAPCGRRPSIGWERWRRHAAIRHAAASSTRRRAEAEGASGSGRPGLDVRNPRDSKATRRARLNHSSGCSAGQLLQLAV